MHTARAADGAAIAYDDTGGTGSLVVLIHGTTECRQAWEPLIEPLSREHRVVALDLRGHGDSERRPPYDLVTMAADVHVVVDTVDEGAPLAVGHSLGGAVASAYAATYPTRGVVNIDQPLALAGFKELLMSAEAVLRGDHETFEATVRSLFGTFYPPLSTEEQARLVACSHPEQDVVLGVWDVVFSLTIDELDALVDSIARTIRSPYLALHGSDPGRDYANWLQKTIPRAQLEVWPDHGHYPHYLDPQRFCERLTRFEKEL